MPDTFTDSQGHVVKLGDFIAFAAGSKRSWLRSGCVCRITPKSVTILHPNSRGGVDKVVSPRADQVSIKVPVTALSSRRLNALLAHDPEGFPVSHFPPEFEEYCTHTMQFKGCRELVGHGQTREEAHASLLAAWHAMHAMGGSLTFDEPNF